MTELLRTLGIDWKLLLAQGVNFFVLLIVLSFLIYRPLIRMLEERRKKIELGVKGGEEVQKRLLEADELKEEKIKQGELDALAIITAAEKDARLRSQQILAEGKIKADHILEEGKKVAEHKRIEELNRLQGEARAIMREAIAKAVEINPAEVDEHLIAGAIKFMKEKTS